MSGDCLPTSGELIAGLNRLRDAMAQVQQDIETVTTARITTLLTSPDAA
jgi:hypothetical protein